MPRHGSDIASGLHSIASFGATDADVMLFEDGEKVIDLWLSLKPARYYFPIDAAIIWRGLNEKTEYSARPTMMGNPEESTWKYLIVRSNDNPRGSTDGIFIPTEFPD